MKNFQQYCLITCLLFMTQVMYAAPAKAYWNQWVPFDPLSKETIQYPIWNQFLNKYAISKNGQVYITYAAVDNTDKQNLKNAITRLSSIKIDAYNRNEQLAYWINLYNMETVYLILQNYPISSITKIKDGFFSFGPWDKKLLTVDGISLSLNDIEHRIIRPMWNDPRIHAAVNCASISCPNLNITPFIGQKINQQLNTAFSEFVNNSKGVKVEGNTIAISKIFEWYGIDFGNKPEDITNFISYYIQSPSKKEAILNAKNISYQTYNWDLNGIK